MTYPPYIEWPKDQYEKLNYMNGFFGDSVLKHVRDYALSRVPEGLDEHTKAQVKKSILDTIYGFMMLVDGIPRNDIDDNHHTEFALIARVYDQDYNCVDSIELAPGGDGLCICYHVWLENDTDSEE